MGCNNSLAAFLQILKETGARSGETANIEWKDVDFERKLVRINHPAKGGLARTIPISETLVNMINQRQRRSNKLFASLTSLKVCFYST
ncbi:MAG: tyrosine-type recombinase/integrase, partial [Nitrososphaerota archaeon]|nr:tyrosine-type recombinase/integrase [Nitrososphaerota archaeon]